MYIQCLPYIKILNLTERCFLPMKKHIAPEVGGMLLFSLSFFLIPSSS